MTSVQLPDLAHPHRAITALPMLGIGHEMISQVSRHDAEKHRPLMP